MNKISLFTISLVFLFGSLTGLHSQANSPWPTPLLTATPEPQVVIYLPVIIKPANDLKIVRIKFDGRDEYIEIKNDGPGNQLMDSWKIVSVVGPQTYDFPSRITLASGHSLRVHSGPDAINNPPGDLRWTTAFIWNNTGDNAEMRDSENVVRDTSCYKAGCP